MYITQFTPKKSMVDYSIYPFFITEKAWVVGHLQRTSDKTNGKRHVIAHSPNVEIGLIVFGI